MVVGVAAMILHIFPNPKERLIAFELHSLTEIQRLMKQIKRRLILKEKFLNSPLTDLGVELLLCRIINTKCSKNTTDFFNCMNLFSEYRFRQEKIRFCYIRLYKRHKSAK